MNKTLHTGLAVAIFLLLIPAKSLHAQECDNQYASVVYKAQTFNNYRAAITTSSKEIIAVGDVYNDHGMIAKFSSKGNPIWAYQYFPPFRFDRVFYYYLHFTSVLQTADGNFLASGYYSRVSNDTNLVAFIAKIDRYGLVKWSKGFQAVYGRHLSLTNLIETSDGDIVVYLASDNGIKNFSYGKVVRLSAEGVIKWSTMLFTGMYDAPRTRDTRRGLIQAKNGDLVLCDVVYEIDRSKPDFPIKESDLHFFALNYATGKLKWETSYEYPRPSFYPTFTPEINAIIEQADGKFRFITSLPMPSVSQPSNNLKPFAIVTDATGHIETVQAYISPEDVHCNVMQAIVDKNTGEHKLLLSRNGTSVLASLSADGQVVAAKGYESSNSLFPPNCMTQRTGGYAIFMSNFSSWNTRLLLTDPDGIIDCKNIPTTLQRDNAVLQSHSFTVNTDVDNNFKDPFEFSNIELSLTKYEIEGNIDCQQAIDCCKDVIDSLNIPRIDICEGKTYLLPDNTPVTDSGRYYASFKTSRGCDSIRFYDVHTIKDPAKLSLGNDTCLQQQAEAVLRATPGYENYNWMGMISNEPTYSVSQPGTYWVNVQNVCGSKTDTVEIYKDCEFPIYMPTAFSPNRDNLNDYYGISSLNKNRFIRLTIFNRWGQAVFQTKTQDKGWDGKFKGVLLDPAVFIYYLEMESLSGKKLTQKGTITLIR